MSAAKDVVEAHATYRGLQYPGEVVALQCGQRLAIDADGGEIGTYADSIAAQDAVRARGRTDG